MIDFEEIKKILPQKFPYYMVDRITELKHKERVVGIKNITGNEICFLGHFPDQSIVPGTMILEIMAQAGAFLFYSEKKKNIQLNFYLGLIKEAKFVKPVVPGDQLKVVLTVKRITTDNAFVHIVGSVDEQTVAESDMIFVRRK